MRQFGYSGAGWRITWTSWRDHYQRWFGNAAVPPPGDVADTPRVVVKDGAETINQLNELEYVKGKIYANVWHSNRITRISPRDGPMLGWINLTGLPPADQMVNAESVLNGTAYDAQHDRPFVTGKRWPAVFKSSGCRGLAEKARPPARLAVTS